MANPIADIMFAANVVGYDASSAVDALAPANERDVHHLLVADGMSRAAVIVDEGSSAADARALADERDVHHLLVTDGDVIVGIACRCDLDWVFDGDSIARCMQVPLLSAKPDDKAEKAAALLLHGRIGCLPVLDGFGSLRGVITRSDLQRIGALPGERGIDCCAACGASHCLFSADGPNTPVFCCDCLDQVQEKAGREPYFTLGGGD
jgi:CBS domain-containing protein